MYLIDTSVWIDFFNGRLEHRIKERIINNIENDTLFYSGIVLTELLIGCKTEGEKDKIKESFQGLIYLPLEKEDFIEISFFGNRLLRKGITVPLTDLIIFYQAYKNELSILTKDKHFNYFENHKIKIEII